MKQTVKILFMGGISKEKGTLEALGIFERLTKLHDNIELLVAGYWQKPSKSWLHTLTNLFRVKTPAEKYYNQAETLRKNLKNKIKVLGIIKDTPELFQTVDILIFPCTAGHFARPVIEASMCGIVSVASNKAPLNELIKNNETGFLINLDNHLAWNKKLSLLVKNPSLREEMGQAARKLALQKFNLNNQMKDLEDIYLGDKKAENKTVQ